MMDLWVLPVTLACGVAVLLQGCGGATTATTPKPPNAIDCPSLPAIPAPKTIADLHPSHVSIVMGIGDSITAGFSARGNTVEARDISWSMGKGSAKSMTFPWLLEQYSPKVEGQSTKAVSPVNLFTMPKGDYHPATDNMNVAESNGAVKLGSMDEQWGYLEGNFKKYDNFDTRWKVLTVWMLANDICNQCGSENVEDTQMYKTWVAGYEKLLKNVAGTLKNTYVNLVSTLDLSNVARIQKKNPTCAGMSKLFEECWCVNNGTPTQLAKLDRNIHVMNNRLHKFAADWKPDARTDLAIVVQPFMEGIGASLDSSFFSNLDCFHPNIAAHQTLAISLWNSMLCTDDRKNQCGTGFKPHQRATCPTKDSVFYTGADVIPSPPTDFNRSGMHLVV